MTKFIKLVTSAYVAGALRHPNEGVLTVEEVEAERIVSDGHAEDVTSDFANTEANDAAPSASAPTPAADGDEPPASPKKEKAK